MSISNISLESAKATLEMIVKGGFATNKLERSPKIDDIRLLAKSRLPKMAFDFIDGAADQEYTREANIQDLARVTFLPDSMKDLRRIDTTTNFLGHCFSTPLLVAPTGLMRLAGSGGELVAVKAAGKAGIPFTISTASSYSMEEIAAEASGPLWFQLYMWKSKEIVKTLVERAKELGVQALVVTIDVAVNGKRSRDHRNSMSIPPRITASNAVGVVKHPRWLLDLMTGPPIGFRNLVGIAEGSTAMSHQEFVNTELANLAASWGDIQELRKIWDGPIIVKGVTSIKDAQNAVKSGADAIWVSNHGGRQLDSLSSSISALARIKDCLPETTKIIFDSGVRQGSDIVKGLAMGADMVAIGRPWVYGLAAAGEKGMEKVAETMLTELVETMILLGQTSTSELDRSMIRFPKEWLE